MSKIVWHPLWTIPKDKMFNYQSSKSETEREENLSSGFQPNDWIAQFAPLKWKEKRFGVDFTNILVAIQIIRDTFRPPPCVTFYLRR